MHVDGLNCGGYFGEKLVVISKLGCHEGSLLQTRLDQSLKIGTLMRLFDRKLIWFELKKKNVDEVIWQKIEAKRIEESKGFWESNVGFFKLFECDVGIVM